MPTLSCPPSQPKPMLKGNVLKDNIMMMLKSSALLVLVDVRCAMEPIQLARNAAKDFTWMLRNAYNAQVDVKFVQMETPALNAEHKMTSNLMELVLVSALMESTTSVIIVLTVSLDAKSVTMISTVPLAGLKGTSNLKGKSVPARIDSTNKTTTA